MRIPDSIYFFKPVDPALDGAPDYYKYIQEPMCLLTIQQKLDNREYKSPDEFIRDMNLIWMNAEQYNHHTHLIYKGADTLAKKFQICSASLPRGIEEDDKNNALQRLVELQFLRYRMNKKTHQ